MHKEKSLEESYHFLLAEIKVNVKFAKTIVF